MILHYFIQTFNFFKITIEATMGLTLNPLELTEVDQLFVQKAR